MTHIASGYTSAEKASFPWMVSFGFYRRGTRDWVHACGGSIVGRYSILSAAHCFTMDG